MSSRGDHRRRDRSWERDDRDSHPRGGRGGGGSSRIEGGYRNNGRRRTSRSRSRSPPRRGDIERRGGFDRRDYGKDREDYRKDRDRRDRLRDDGRESKKDRDDRRNSQRKEGNRASVRQDQLREQEVRFEERTGREQIPESALAPSRDPSQPQPNLDLDIQDHHDEDGEAINTEDDDDAAMRAMMGLSGFSTTKGKQVDGNQEGAVNVKKMRTWRQYMNRRGGFNRPLDKIK